MRRLLVLVLCCLSGFHIALSQNQGLGHQTHLYQHSRRAISLPPPKSIQLHGTIGMLPNIYDTKLSKLDEVATLKAGSVFKEALYAAFPDTYTVKEYGPINIHIPNSYLRGKMYLNNVVVKGIHQIVLRQLEVRTKNKRIDFTAFAPAISANMDYEVDGLVVFAPIILSGTISLSEQNLNLSGAISVQKTKFYHYHDERYQVVAGDVNAEIQNMNMTIRGNALFEDVEFLKEPLIEETKNKVAELIMGAVFKHVNKVLKEISAADIYNFITKYN